MYQITVQSTFSAAHALRLTDGTLEPVHGHDWRITVRVGCEQLDSLQTVMDFHELERILEEVVSPFRNRHLNDLDPFADGQVNPTAERVAWWVGTRVDPRLPAEVNLVEVTVGEAPGCLATYRP